VETGFASPENEGAPSLCFVTDELSELLDSQAPLARALESFTAASWKVCLLYYGPEGDDQALAQVSQRLAQAGIRFAKLGDFPPPSYCDVATSIPDESGTLHLSMVLRLALESLHGRHHFDLIEIPSGRGVGMCTIQAKLAGLAFGDSTLLVRLTGPGPRQREDRKLWDTPHDLLLDHGEQTTFENADVQLSPRGDLLEAARNLGWQVSPRARVVPVMDPALYANLLHDARRSSRPSTEVSADGKLDPREPLVTVAVSHYNLGAYLPQTLASLASQTYSNLEVFIVDDGSTCPQSREVFDQQERLYPHFRFLRQSNAGPGAARNRALGEARGELFIPVDADNIARSDMVEVFARGMQTCPRFAVMTCFGLGFREDQDIAEEKFLFLINPTGGPHPLACAYNVYGDTNAVFRTTALRAVGGFETDRNTPCEDWETFIKLVNRGYCLGVIPQPLYYYRRRKDSRSGVMTQEWTDCYPFVKRILKEFYVPRQALPEAEARVLWSALASYLLTYDLIRIRLAQPKEPPPLRHRIVDRLNQWLRKVPLLQPLCKGSLRVAGRLLHWIRRDDTAEVTSSAHQIPPSARIRSGGSRVSSTGGWVKPASR
jgi:glycosyltransferase involved in cell wall biosynthesis